MTHYKVTDLHGGKYISKRMTSCRNKEGSNPLILILTTFVGTRPKIHLDSKVSVMLKVSEIWGLFRES